MSKSETGACQTADEEFSRIVAGKGMQCGSRYYQETLGQEKCYLARNTRVKRNIN